jgi:CRP-like cAMP-binding protein
MFDWSLFHSYAEVKRLKKGDILFRQGDSGDGFYYLQAGMVMISVLREDGYERVVDFVYPGSLIGEQRINRSTSFNTATLIVDSTLYYFSKSQFERLVRKYPQASLSFGHSLVRKIRMMASINKILNAPVDIQLAHFLLMLYTKSGDNAIDITQTLMAKYLGKSRVSIWKVLKEWRNEDVLEICNQSLRLKDIQHLQKIVNQYHN